MLIAFDMMKMVEHKAKKRELSTHTQTQNETQANEPMINNTIQAYRAKRDKVKEMERKKSERKRVSKSERDRKKWWKKKHKSTQELGTV